MTTGENENGLKLATHFCATEVASALKVASSPEIRYINVLEPFVSASVLLYYAVLAYPSCSEWPKRRPFVEAMAAMRFREFALQGAPRKDIPAHYKRFKREKMLSRWRLGWKRVDRRIHAGIMGWFICLNERSYEHKIPTPDGKMGLVLRGPHTVSEVVQTYVVQKQNDPNEAHVESAAAQANVSSRVWAESFPVLHLAMTNPTTVKIIELQVNKETLDPKNIAKDLFDSVHHPGWLRKALEEAETLRPTLGGQLGTDPNDALDRGFIPEKAIRLLPTENLSQAYRL